MTGFILVWISLPINHKLQSRTRRTSAICTSLYTCNLWTKKRQTTLCGSIQQRVQGAVVAVAALRRVRASFNGLLAIVVARPDAHLTQH